MKDYSSNEKVKPEKQRRNIMHMLFGQYVYIYPYVTVPEKRVLVAQIMIFRYRRFSATTPKNNSRDKTFVFVSEVSPTLCLHSR